MSMDEGYALQRRRLSIASSIKNARDEKKAKAARAFVGLHSDTVIQNQQCDKWAKWYNNGEDREHPEFDIYGPYTRPEEKVLADSIVLVGSCGLHSRARDKQCLTLSQSV